MCIPTSAHYTVNTYIFHNVEPSNLEKNMLILMSLFHIKHEEPGFVLTGLLTREGNRLKMEVEEKKTTEEVMVSLELHRTNHLVNKT
jgi:hypothetical protein